MTRKRDCCFGQKTEALFTVLQPKDGGRNKTFKIVVIDIEMRHSVGRPLKGLQNNTFTDIPVICESLVPGKYLEL